MSKRNDTSLTSLYHQVEDYFFTSISQKYHHFSDSACAYLTGVEAGDLNLLIVKQPDAFIDSVLKDGIRLFEAAGLPFSVVLPGDVIGQVSHQFCALGLTAAYTSVAMQLAMEHFVPQSNVCGEYEIMRTDGRLVDWALPLESAFESNRKIMLQCQTRHQEALDSGKQLSHFSLYVKSRPVCSLTLSIDNGIARLDDIGTQPEFQGKRCASALIQHALIHARSRNVALCFLEASAEGASIYRRAGFSALFDYAAFHRE
jgi:GNAT superfamily N-acetyltransferase